MIEYGSYTGTVDVLDMKMNDDFSKYIYPNSRGGADYALDLIQIILKKLENQLLTVYGELN